MTRSSATAVPQAHGERGHASDQVNMLREFLLGVSRGTSASFLPQGEGTVCPYPPYPRLLPQTRPPCRFRNGQATACAGECPSVP